MLISLFEPYLAPCSEGLRTQDRGWGAAPDLGGTVLPRGWTQRPSAPCSFSGKTVCFWLSARRGRGPPWNSSLHLCRASALPRVGVKPGAFLPPQPCPAASPSALAVSSSTQREDEPGLGKEGGWAAASLSSVETWPKGFLWL